jgi:SEC-C motif-containing protein
VVASPGRQTGRVSTPSRCPCLSGAGYDECCGPYHAGVSEAPTAERLMRSRYAAFVLADADYLRRTWHASTRPASLDLDVSRRWLGLEILATERGGLFDSVGTVEFRARRAGAALTDGGRSPATEQHETSRFVRVEEGWRYLCAL